MIYAGIVFRQLISMAIYVLIGYILSKTKLMSEEGTKSFANLLIYLILPCAIISSFCREATSEQTVKMLISLGLSVGLIVISVVISHFLFKKKPVDNFSSCFSNVGFMGIPLITATLGGESVFYIAGLVAMMNMMQWIYGQRLLSKEQTKLNVKTLLLNPLSVAFILGLILYFVPFSLPEQVMTCVKAIAGCNSPIAMIILGCYLSKVPFKTIFTSGSAYIATFSRLLLIPVVTALFLAVIPGVDENIRMAMLISACTPVGTNVAVYAQKLGQDYSRAVVLICQSTIFCVVTMPLVILLSAVLF